MTKHIFIIIITLLYVCQSLAYFLSRDYGQSLMVGAYALANVGLIWSMV